MNSATNLGHCPDCNHSPISLSCKVCPKCGCQKFICLLGPIEQRVCNDCGGTSYYCETCHGHKTESYHQVIDHRTGKVYWERGGYLSYIGVFD